MYVGSDSSLEGNQTPVHRKLLAPAVGGGWTAYMDPQARPFSDLGPDDLLDTADLCRLFGISGRTAYRWINQPIGRLAPRFKAGRLWLFAKSNILNWYAANRPRPGRPPLSGR